MQTRVGVCRGARNRKEATRGQKGGGGGIKAYSEGEELRARGTIYLTSAPNRETRDKTTTEEERNMPDRRENSLPPIITKKMRFWWGTEYTGTVWSVGEEEISVQSSRKLRDLHQSVVG